MNENQKYNQVIIKILKITKTIIKVIRYLTIIPIILIPIAFIIYFIDQEFTLSIFHLGKADLLYSLIGSFIQVIAFLISSSLFMHYLDIVIKDETIFKDESASYLINCSIKIFLITIALQLLSSLSASIIESLTKSQISVIEIKISNSVPLILILIGIIIKASIEYHNNNKEEAR